MFKTIKLAVVASVATLGIALTPVAEAASLDRHVLLVNNSHYTIREFHASNISRPSWEEDILGRNMLPSGEEVRINLDDGSGYCKFDFLTVFDDGTKVVRRDVNVCQVDRYTITD